MTIKRTDEKLIKDIEEWNKQERTMDINFDKQSFEYIGIYKLLDELLTRIVKCNDINIVKEYCELYEKIYKLIKVGESDESKRDV